ncbi:MAG: helix-turn-helix domain-containing protein [Gammaproteobacteria bacterium]|nr:helix-turn-helix domain-containing protein [Gammaproteobacteria bacterium]
MGKKSKQKTVNDLANEAISEIADILHDMGKIDEAALKEYAIEMPKVKELKPSDIKKIRKKIKVSQPIFAKLLNISPETVKKWEQGDRHPAGASLKLLNLVAKHGLQVLY